MSTLYNEELLKKVRRALRVIRKMKVNVGLVPCSTPEELKVLVDVCFDALGVACSADNTWDLYFLAQCKQWEPSEVLSDSKRVYKLQTMAHSVLMLIARAAQKLGE